MQARWIRLIHEVRCIGCRRTIAAGLHIYSLTGSEYGYCMTCGRVAEQAMKRNEAHRERERRIIRGCPSSAL